MKTKLKGAVSCFLAICIVFGLFAVSPARVNAETITLDGDGFNAAIADNQILLTSGNTYQLQANIDVDQGLEIMTGGAASIDLNGHKITVASGCTLVISSGITVTGAVYAADNTGIEVYGNLSINGGSVNVSGDSAIGVKVNHGARAELRQGHISAPGIALYANSGNVVVDGNATTINANNSTGTAIKADGEGSVLLIDFDRIEAKKQFDNTAGGFILNFKGIVSVYEATGTTKLNLSNPLPSGTDIMLKYSDSKAEDAAGTRVYYTTSGSEPTAETETFLDDSNLSDIITINSDMVVKMGIFLGRFINLPPINITELYAFDDFLEEFDAKKGNGGTIVLPADLVIPQGREITLSSTGLVTINTGVHRIIVDNNNVNIDVDRTILTIKENVKIRGNGNGNKPNSGVVSARNSGEFQMLGGIVESTATNGAAVCAASGKVEIQGGTIYANGTNGTGVLIYNGGNVNIAGGKIIANSVSGVGVKADGQYASATILGGSIKANTAKMKGTFEGEHPEKIYDFRGIEITTSPAYGFVPVGTSVTISSRELAGDLHPMDAVGASVYYTTDDSSVLDFGTSIPLSDGTKTVTIDTGKAINAAAVLGDGSGGKHGSMNWFPYIVSDSTAIDSAIVQLRGITSYSWAHDAVEQLFRKFIMPELNPTALWLGSTVERARLAKLVSLAFKLPHDSYFRASFVADADWNSDNQGFVRYIEIAKNYFIHEEDTFEPDSAVTREQMVYTIIKVLGLNVENISDELAEAATKYSKDWNTVDAQCKPYVALASKMGIVSGFNGYFKPEDPISNAEMAVLLNRALKFSGGVGIGIFADVKPGDYGYEAVMDLASRMPKDASSRLKIDASNFGVNTNASEADWNAWVQGLHLSLESNEYPGPDTTKRVDAAIQLINALPGKIPGQVFSDVAPADWCYDGVMNLYNRGIVNGFEDGSFRPNDVLITNSFALLIARLEGIPVIDWQIAESQANIRAYFPNNTAGNTREAAAYAILKLCDIDTSGMDPVSVDATLARFVDKADISDACKPAIAYLVSIGAMNGDENGNLYPKVTLTRGTFAVFYSRVLNGLDASKMKDYMDTIEAAE